MEMKLELVPIPVSDVDRAKASYVEEVGFKVDHDTRVSDTLRVVQLTPAGSACSVVIGTGMPEIDKIKPGSVKGLHLVVRDVHEAREALASRGVGTQSRRRLMRIGRGARVPRNANSIETPTPEH